MIYTFLFFCASSVCIVDTSRFIRCTALFALACALNARGIDDDSLAWTIVFPLLFTYFVDKQIDVQAVVQSGTMLRGSQHKHLDLFTRVSPRRCADDLRVKLHIVYVGLHGVFKMVCLVLRAQVDSC